MEQTTNNEFKHIAIGAKLIIGYVKVVIKLELILEPSTIIRPTSINAIVLYGKSYNKTEVKPIHVEFISNHSDCIKI